MPDEQQKEVAIPEKFKTLVEQIEKLSAIDLAELVKVLEARFGVSAAAPMMAMAVASSPAGAAAAVEEQSTFNVELTEAGANKIGVIKVVREVTQKGLKEAKDLVDGAPKIVKEGASKKEADEIKQKIEAAGGKATLK